MLAKSLFDTLGVKDLSLEINSIGCPTCRAEYHKALKEYFSSRKDELCDTCKSRLDRNPMRILDCKSPVFEFVSNSIGAQGTVCGGGRYDGLVEELGGQHTPSLGFAMGIERLMLLMEAQGCEFPEAEKPDLFIVALGEKATLKAVEIAKDQCCYRR